MRIIAISLENFQNIRDKLIVPLSPNKTRLKGNNATGKSTIHNGLTLFSGIYTRNKLTALRTKNIGDNKVTEVKLLLENFSVMICRLYGNLKLEYIYKDRNNNIIKQWDGFNNEIKNILNFKVTENNKFLNLKKGKYNILIDTSPSENSELIEEICTDKILEKRIENIEISLQDQKKIDKDIQARYKELYNKYEEYNIFKPDKMYNQILNILEEYKNTKNSIKIKEIVDEINTENDIKGIKNSIENLENMLKFIVKYKNILEIIELMKIEINVKNRYIKIKNMKDMIIRLNLLNKCNKLIKTIEKIKGNENLLNNIYKVKYVCKNIINFNKYINDRISFIRYKKVYDDVTEVNKKLNAVGKLKGMLDRNNCKIERKCKNDINKLININNKIQKENKYKLILKNNINNIKNNKEFIEIINKLNIRLKNIKSNKNINSILKNTEIINRNYNLNSSMDSLKYNLNALNKYKSILDNINKIENKIEDISKTLIEKEYLSEIISKIEYCPVCGSRINKV